MKDAHAPRPLDFLISGLLFAAILGEILVNDLPGLRVVLVGSAFVQCLLLVWRRSHSALVAVGVVLANTIPNYFGTPTNQSPTFSVVAIVIAMFSLGRYGLTTPPQRLRGYLAIGLCLASFTVMTVHQSGLRVGEFIFFSIFALAPLLFGRAISVSQAERAKAEATTERVVRSSEQLRELAIQDERERIARELHDVIAHSVSLMGLQAGAARKVLPAGNDAVEASLRSIEETGRDTIGELRRMLGVMRDGNGGDDLAPQPGLGALPELVEQLAAGGVDVKLDLGEGTGGLSPGVDLAAYRIVQEALTNSMRHAPACPVEIEAGVHAGRIELRVVSRGAVEGEQSSEGTGNGLVGMRERASLYGGELHADFQPGEGFVVNVGLPAEYRSAEWVVT